MNDFISRYYHKDQFLDNHVMEDYEKLSSYKLLSRLPH